MRRNLVVGNWKMNLDIDEGISLVDNVLKRLSLQNETEVVFAPSYVHLDKVSRICNNRSDVFVASQNCSSSEIGPHTGEISAEMISSCGAKYVILGHSERRINFSESNEILNAKVKQALANNLHVIFCCGESLFQRNSGAHFELIKSQILESLFDFSSEEFSRIIIAYEPIWAIGTGVTASSLQAQEVHSFIRSIIKEKYGNEISQRTLILYGGSCNPSNASELFSQLDIDGGLIGSASLDANDFVAITNSF
jgi:triosephosphate isomerase